MRMMSLLQKCRWCLGAGGKYVEGESLLDCSKAVALLGWYHIDVSIIRSCKSQIVQRVESLYFYDGCRNTCNCVES